VAAFLAHRFRYHAAEVWAERLAAGAVRVNGGLASADLVVRHGDHIEYTLWHEEPEVDFRFEILHEDDRVLAVSKPGNLPVHAGGKYIRNTLIAKLRETHGDELRPAHRLDRETSGVVLLAKGREAAAALEREFHARRVRKAYVAILRGEAPEDIVVDAPIARLDPKGGSSLRVVDPLHGKPSRTVFHRIAARPAERTLPARSFVVIRPESGRTNQIRVHAKHVGHPVLGDKVYGVPERMAAGFAAGTDTPGILAAAGAPRHLLHCAFLSVQHPAPGAPLLVLTAAPPPDFADSWGGPLPPFAVSLPGIDSEGRRAREPLSEGRSP
jgi:RluA family pseudouridine synthase